MEFAEGGSLYSGNVSLICCTCVLSDVTDNLKIKIFLVIKCL